MDHTELMPAVVAHSATNIGVRPDILPRPIKPVAAIVSSSEQLHHSHLPVSFSRSQTRVVLRMDIIAAPDSLSSSVWQTFGSHGFTVAKWPRNQIVAGTHRQWETRSRLWQQPPPATDHQQGSFLIIDCCPQAARRVGKATRVAPSFQQLQ
jgi:hypothetical protein